MALDPAKLLSLPPIEVVHSYAARDTILYALGVGAGIPADIPEGEAVHLPFLFEDCLQALPTMAVVLGYPGFFLHDPAYGVTWRKMLHAEQSVQIFHPIPSTGTVKGVTRIVGFVDKGAERGALMHIERVVTDMITGTLLAKVRQTNFLRADGGFGAAPSGDFVSPAPVPDRTPDTIVTYATRPEQALIYRLSGDMNPLHIDPSVASAAGFDRPILHGLATFGIVGRALLAECAGNAPDRVQSIAARFTSPVLPGETIQVAIWKKTRSEAAFRAHVVERDIVVLNNGQFHF
jgi:acyl dehydratase